MYDLVNKGLLRYQFLISRTGSSIFLYTQKYIYKIIKKEFKIESIFEVFENDNIDLRFLQKYSSSLQQLNTEMSVNQLQQIANIACFSVDYQKKNEAENYFTEFIKNPSIPVLIDILKNGSETLIFVTIQYLNKFIQNFTINHLKDIFNSIQKQISAWYQTNQHKFIRALNLMNGNNVLSYPNQTSHLKQVTKYVENSISLFLSNCMKRFYLQENQQQRKQILEWIGSVANQRYRLWLYKIFIQNISQIDSTMGFIKFRTLSYNFQEQVIPIISKCLVPFLYQVQDIMKINQISLLQKNLNVEQQTISQRFINTQIVFNSQNQFKFAELIFDLLHAIVFYNYHLTYTQYEQESTFQNCLISFPEQFTSKVVTEEFINSLGYVIERLIDLMPQSKFLKTTLQCLQKIFLAKLSYIDEKRKINFIKECANLLTKNLSKANLTPFILTKLMVCNNKFITSVQLSFFKQKPELKQSFHCWIETITKTTILLFQNIDLSEQFSFNLQESVIIECLDLYQKIVSSVCSISYYGFQESQSTVEEKEYIKRNVDRICEILLRKILGEHKKPLIYGSTAEIFKCNIFQMKTFCSSFFHPFRQLCSLNYTFLFHQIQKNLIYSLDMLTPLSLKFNSFMLLSQIMDRNYLQRNIIMTKASDEEVFILSKCFNMGLRFLYSYMENKLQHFVQDEQIILLDMSILTFFDKILSEFLGCFENSDQNIEIRHKIFKNILQIQNKTFNSNQISQEFLLFCIESVLGYLLIYNKTQETKHINEFIFETINRLLMKFKWSLKRQTFKNSIIYKKLSDFFNKISILSQIKVNNIQVNGDLQLFHQFQKIKWRKKLIKIIALLYFDDVIDDYRRNLNNIFESLKDQHLLTIMLDIQGLGDAIDTSSIFKTFLEMIEKYFTIERITNQIVNLANYYVGYDNVTKKYPKIKIIKEVLKMHKAILCNKGQRFSNLKNLQGIYFMVKDLMGYWRGFLLLQENQGQSSLLKEILQIITELIKCDKINFYLLQRMCLKEYIEFFSVLFMKLEQHFEGMNEYPKIWQSFLSFMLNVSRELLSPIFIPTNSTNYKNLLQNEIIYKQKQNLIKKSFMRLFLLVFHKAGSYLQQLKAMNKKNQTVLDKCLQIIRFTLHFCAFKLNQHITHKTEINVLADYFTELKPHIFLQIKIVFSYLTFEKHYSVIKRNLILILYEASLIYPQILQILIGQLNLPTYLINEAKDCIEYIRKQQQQLFVDCFKAWLRMLHMSEEQYKKKKSQNHEFCQFMTII